MNRRLEILDWAVGAAVAVLALVVYTVTCSVGAYPGESAAELVKCLGVLPTPSPDEPIWRWLAGSIGALAGVKAVAALNGFAVLCGGLAVWLMYRVTSSVLCLTISFREIDDTRARLAAMLGGAVAAFFLAFCVPFWVCGTRATEAALHTVMLLGSAWVFVVWWRDGRGWQLLLFWALCGLGVVEFATFILFVPLAAGLTIYRLWTTDLLTVRRLMAISGAGLCPMLLYAIAAGMFTGSEGYELRGYESYGQVLWYWWKDQYMQLRHSLPQVGWLLVLCLTVVPWVTMLTVARHALNRSTDRGLLVLHIVLTGVMLILLFNLKISPWRLLGWGRILVTPYVLAGSLFGYLAAYAFLLPQAWWSAGEGAPASLQRRRDLTGALLGLSFFAVVVLAPFRNLSEADGRRSVFVNKMAHEIVDTLGRREWLVTDGLMDNHILLAARERGKMLRTINLFDRSDIYVRLLSKRFDQPSYRNLMQVSTSGFVREWLEKDPDAERKVAIMAEPDLWLGSGFSAIPSRMLYLGQVAGSTGEPLLSELMADHRAFWAGVHAMPNRKSQQPADRLEGFLMRHIGSVANNLGVFLEDAGQTNDAFAAYQEARRLDPENVSALLNIGVMLDRGFVSGDKTAIESDLATLARTAKRNVSLWTLSRHYGYVRMPEFYVRVGWNWVMSGHPGLGASRMLRAVELKTDPASAQVARQALAFAYLAQNDKEASEAVCRELLQKDPSNVAGLVGMARIHMRNRNLPAAASFLERAEKTGFPARNLAFDWASLHLSAGDPTKARVILERLVDEEPRLVRGWAMLAGIHANEKDVRALDRCLDRLDSLAEGRGVAALIRGKIALDRSDFVAARRNLDFAHKAMPSHAGVLDNLLRVDLVQARSDTARTHALALLRLRPNHALANYTLGTLSISEGKFDLAEDSLRRSMEAEKTPAVLNDLGWLLSKRGRHKEAEEMVRSALAMRDDMYQAWDTLGVILTKVNRLDEAEDALRKALALFTDDPVVHLHTVEIHLLRGNKDAARRVIDTIKGRRDLMQPDDQMRFDQINLSLGSGDK